MLHFPRAFCKLGISSLMSLLYVILSAAIPTISYAQNSPNHHDHSSMSMPMDDATDPAAQAKLFADKKRANLTITLPAFSLSSPVFSSSPASASKTAGRQSSTPGRSASFFPEFLF